MTHPLTIAVERLAHGLDLPLPAYQSAGAAGLDLMAAVASPVTLAPGARALIPTGLKLAIPQGYEGQVRPRSGLALKHGVTVLNAPGTIDADYRGEVQVVLINHGSEPFQITHGLRMAQLVIAPVSSAVLRAHVSLQDTARGTGSFGSTGVERAGETP